MKKSITITIDEELISALSLVAEEEGRTMSGLINKIIKDFLASQGKT